ncbi:hypothetical protein B0H16DRAFT_1828888 [Mycena metata]|uniref:Uncharacterized protein n=1 Tax=Mycena metata TaxID=1033252 RepID=A0AAD7NCX0_9AGAR|nr:hypothetical protein B0H16DRAFT_1722266 [Mycena metata]KAJ7755547.1 hypothetical protein B0H16DRAFT_1828888 [Mycena metata]
MRGHPCPHCGNFLVPRLAKGGQVPDSEFVRCANPIHPPYFYRYPPNVTNPSPTTFTTTTATTATTMPPQAYTFPAHASSNPTVPTPAVPTHAQPQVNSKPPCEAYSHDGRRCTSTRIDRGCPRKMCRKHCVAVGLCTLRSHAKHQETKERNKPYARVPTIASTSASRLSSATATGLSRATATAGSPIAPADPWMGWDASFDEIRDSVTLPLRILEENSLRERERAADAEREFDNLIGFRSSPELSVEEELALMEQDDISLALRLSAEEHRPPMSSILPSPSPLPAPGSSHLRLRSLSPSPDLPESVAAALAASQVFVPLPTEEPRRRRRQPAASTANKRRPQSQVQITTQLNETWMAINGASPAPSPATTLPSSTVFHVRNGGSRRPFADKSQIERFILVFLTGAAPCILSVDASGIKSPRWPTYILSADDKTLAELASELLDSDGFPVTQLDLFLHRQRVWIGIDRDYPHTVSTGDVLILRRRGVHGPQDQTTIDKFLAPDAPAHLRYNLPRERAAIRNALKDVITVDSDSDVELPEVARQGKGRKGKGKRKARSGDDDEVLVLSPRRPRLNIQTSGLIVPSTSTTNSSAASPPPSALFLRSASTTSSMSEPPTPLEDFIQLPERNAWPSGMYTIDVVAGFLRIESDAVTGTLPSRFNQVFGGTWTNSTWYYNLKMWKTASEGLKHAILAAGRTSEGSWSVFREKYREEREVIDLT